MDLLEELNSVEIVEPEEELPPEDQIKRVIEMTDIDLKKIYSYCEYLYTGRFKFEGSYKEAWDIAAFMRLKRKILLELFWLEVGKRYDLVSERKVSIHKGWKLAVLK